jgi:hypothetical protein
MNYKIQILLSAALLLTLSTMPCNAGNGKKKLLLFAKNPSTWEIIKNGGSGKLVYREANGSFTFHAVKLQPRTAYALARYADAPPTGEILARGVSDARGRLELSGTWLNWTKKFWLVTVADLSGAPGETGVLRAWHPENYLFEEKPLGIPCNCPEPEEP